VDDEDVRRTVGGRSASSMKVVHTGVYRRGDGRAIRFSTRYGQREEPNVIGEHAGLAWLTGSVRPDREGYLETKKKRKAGCERPSASITLLPRTREREKGNGVGNRPMENVGKQNLAGVRRVPIFNGRPAGLSSTAGPGALSSDAIILLFRSRRPKRRQEVTRRLLGGRTQG